MVLTYTEEKELVVLKHIQAKELIELKSKDRLVEHNQKVERLKLQLEIAKAGGEQSD